jgi:hypothetical protein
MSKADDKKLLNFFERTQSSEKPSRKYKREGEKFNLALQKQSNQLLPRHAEKDKQRTRGNFNNSKF